MVFPGNFRPLPQMGSGLMTTTHLPSLASLAGLVPQYEVSLFFGSSCQDLLHTPPPHLIPAPPCPESPRM